MTDKSGSENELEPSSIDAGALPAWDVADLPEPAPFTFRNALRTIGPGAILLAGAIGGGEWIAGPMMVVQYGREILWIATVSIVLQMIFNLEAVRYTLYTGEPALTGIMRLQPGSKFWASFYSIMGIVQLATPGLALGCANVVFAAAMMRLPDDRGADASTVLWISYGILLATVLLLLSGKSIEKVLERLSWFMVTMIFGFLLIVNVLFVPLAAWRQTALGFVTPSTLPEEMDVLLFALFAATAGAGGLGNLAVSNWIRDKGFGMGAYMGGFGGVLAEDRIELAANGKIFLATAENLRRWGHWWRYALVDQSLLWGAGCLFGMFLTVNLTAAIIPAGTPLSGYAVGAFQAQYMADRLWQGFWALCLVNGFWVLFSTHVANSDVLTRTVADMGWAAWPRLRRWGSSRLYAGLLLAFSAWGVFALAIGENALALFKVLGLIASPVLAISALQLLRVNQRFLPKELQPPLWRRIGLVLCSAFYAVIAAATVRDILG